MRDAAIDPDGAASSRITTMLMLPSCLGNTLGSANIHLSRLIPAPAWLLSTLQTSRCRDARKTRSRLACCGFGRIVSVAVIVAVGLNSDGRREVLGMDIGPSEAETFWTAFLRKLARRGLRGVKLVVSDAHEGIKATVAKVLNASWQRCRVHFMRNALAHAGKSGRRVVSAFIAAAFAQDDAEAAQA